MRYNLYLLPKIFPTKKYFMKIRITRYGIKEEGDIGLLIMLVPKVLY